MALPDQTQETRNMARIRVYLKELAEERGLTRTQVKDGAGLTYPTVRAWWDNNVKLLEPTTLVKLARFLDVPESALYSIEGDGDE